MFLFTCTYITFITEPNLLSHTAHSISKKGVKKRDLNDTELRDILCDLISLVRIDHVIPYNNDVLNSAIKRGLISSPPLHMMGDECQSVPVSTWIRNKCCGTFTKPRLFTPYFEEAKVCLVFLSRLLFCDNVFIV